MKQSAVEWLIEQIKYDQNNQAFSASGWQSIFEQAKEMEKHQIIDAFDEGQEYEYQYHVNSTPKFDSETYFTETYGSKGSDDKYVCYKCKNKTDNKFEICNECNVGFTSSQTEISDEEIREQGIKYDNQALSETPIAHFMEGAFWYREQLKKKQ